MLKRPSSRRKALPQGIILNLVPILDAMVTLIAFLLFTMSFLQLASIESPFPEASAKTVEQRLKEKPLQLTLTLRDKEAEIWSPFQRVETKEIPNLPDGLPDVRAIHEALIQVKKQFPREQTMVLVPYPSADYDTLIAVMDASRNIEATDEPIYLKNEQTGLDEPVKTLFPNVVFGNLLGDG